MTEPNPYQAPKTPLAGEAQSKNENQRELDWDKLIVLATFESSVEAHLLRNDLEAQGVEARIANETSTSIFGPTFAGPSSAFWIEVLVMKQDAEKALAIKTEFLAKTTGDDEQEIPEWKCHCGEVVDSGFAVCWNCEAEYQAPN